MAHLGVGGVVLAKGECWCGCVGADVVIGLGVIAQGDCGCGGWHVGVGHWCQCMCCLPKGAIDEGW